MKKVLGILLALMLVLAFSLPVIAGDPPPKEAVTGVVVSSGTGSPPIIKAKWEQLDPAVCADLEDGDPEHLTLLTQLNPPLTFEAKIYPQFWAIVTDPQDVSTVSQVWINVYHPEGMPECGSWKYKKDLDEQDKGIIGSGGAIDAFITARDAGLVTCGTDEAGVPYTYADILEELVQCHAKVYMGVGELDYHQPAGDYLVVADACDINNNWASDWGHALRNLLTYMAIPAIEIDFSTVDYGEVDISHDSWVAGDQIFLAGDSKPTVRNIGNTEVKLCIQQDDMGFGYAGVPPVITWNVEFDVRLGEPPCPDIRFAPAGVKGDPALPIHEKSTHIDPTLPLCNTQKINFSIHVKQGASEEFLGKMWIGYCSAPFSGTCS